MNERVIFIAQDGHRYPLTTTSGSRAVLSDEGTGMPPIEYITERGPYQDGESVDDFFLQPRIMQYVIRQNFCSRDAYWAGRAALLDALRPNRGVSGVIRKYLSNGAKRDFTVAILEGPKFEAQNPKEWQQWSFQEVIRFIAHNPVAFDPEQHDVEFIRTASTGFPYTFPFAFTIPSELEFPIEFPIEFYGFDVEHTIEYAGNYKEYPQVVITGPVRDYAEIVNETTGKALKLQGYEIAAGETVTFDLTYGRVRVFDAAGNNLSNYARESDLVEFCLEPGDNLVHAVMYGAGAASKVNVTYHDRYIGF